MRTTHAAVRRRRRDTVGACRRRVRPRAIADEERHDRGGVVRLPDGSVTRRHEGHEVSNMKRLQMIHRKESLVLRGLDLRVLRVLRGCLCAAQEQMPRFRAGANLVRVDAYVSKDDVALTDLKAEDFALFEDDKPQQIENFQLVRRARPTRNPSARDPTNVRDMNQQAEDAARVFTLFFDRMFVSSVRVVSRAQADHRDARSRDRSRRPGRRDDAGDVAGFDHLQPPHRQHRARRDRHLALGRARARR